jgi:subtilisin family serine protease
MNRLALILTVIIAVGVPRAAPAAEPSARATPAGVGKFRPAFEPWAMTRDARVTVMVELQGAPVALVQEARAARLGKAEKEGLERTLRSRQVGFAREIRARGGEVLRDYQHALNGLRVRVARSELARIAALPGVAAIRPIAQMWPDAEGPANAVSVPYIGTPAAWDDAGVRGEGIKVAVIDTGIDYTHANFGGPGTAADFEAAFAASTLPANPAWFGPAAVKVKGGTDLVGDGYDASSDDPAVNTPVPDPNPLDCNGHGSHVAGTTLGYGVTSAGARYTGPYTAAAVAAESWRVGPGVAPLADLYAVRVFGCEGSTDVTVDAIEWAVANDMDVINMSLGSSFGSADDASALASENAARAGVLVVTSAGNAGSQPYLSGSPGSGNRVIATAATDATTPLLPAATVSLSTGGSIVALNANDAALPGGALAIHVLRTASGAISLGCDEAEYAAAAAQIAGKLVVSLRGVCARVDRAIFGEKYGAAAAAMINNAAGYPPFEGEIPTSLLAAGHVTIPFLGIRGGTAPDGAALVGAASATLAPTTLPNGAYERFATFTSGGPRNGDSALKPNISAPGVSILSTLVGSGNGGFRNSGTSMASPHVAGVAALVKQAHPGWKTSELQAAILGTANPTAIKNYAARLGGAGLVQPGPAVRTQVVAVAQAGRALNLSFGFAELKEGEPFEESQEVKVVNRGGSAATFDVATALAAGSPHTVAVWPTRVTVGARREATVRVRLTVPAGTAGNSDALRQVAGFVTFTPTSPASNGGIALRVPYYMVPRARSDIESRASGLSASSAGAAVTLTNEEGSIAGYADFYALGTTGAVTPGAGTVDLRAVGVQSFPDGAGDALVAFAVNVHNRFNTAAVNEYDVYVDGDLDGVYDFAVVGIDFGLITAGSFDGRVATVVFDLRTGDGFLDYLGFAPTNGSTVLLFADASRLGLSPGNPRFAYTAEAISFETGAFDATGGAGLFNAFTSAVSTGDFATVPVGGSVAVPLAIDGAEWALTPPAGVMVVNMDDKAGPRQADLLPAR